MLDYTIQNKYSILQNAMFSSHEQFKLFSHLQRCWKKIQECWKKLLILKITLN